MDTPRLLILDRRSRSTDRMVSHFEAAGLEVLSSDGLEEARAVLEQDRVEVVVARTSLDGESLLEACGAEGTPLILLEDFGSEREKMEVLARGVFDVIQAPASPETVALVVARALEQRSLRSENRRLRQAIGERFELGNLVSRDARMQRIFQTVDSVADSRASLLLEGESGTGKTVLARAIHERSSRREAPFVVVNCGALPSSLLESELFGHVRGAFTGAVRDRQGKFEAADGGTLFLDEIATASLELQIKLLRAIEEGCFEKVGDSRTWHVDVRLIAASNRDLTLEVGAGRFREDLFYRINVVGLRLPPLRERPSDVPLLARRFLRRFARQHERPVTDFGPEALSRLCAHPWPGNVRELENTVERAVLLSTGSELGPFELWPDTSVPSPTTLTAEPAAGPSAQPWGELPLGPLKEALAIPERWLILRALHHHGGNRQETARTLGINRTTLFNKMRKYHLLSFPTKMEEGGDPADLREAG